MGRPEEVRQAEEDAAERRQRDPHREAAGTLFSAVVRFDLQGWAGGLTHGWVDLDLDVPLFCQAT